MDRYIYIRTWRLSRRSFMEWLFDLVLDSDCRYYVPVVRRIPYTLTRPNVRTDDEGVPQDAAWGWNS